jgi:DNA-binding transcriptional LysR family regulator
MVDLIREGIDCVIRAGPTEDSSMIRRGLGQLHEITCASPDYLARHGKPENLSDLDGHQMIGFVSSRTNEVMPLEFTRGEILENRLLPARVTVNNSTTAAELARAGFGLIQAPRYRFAAQLASGELVEVLADFPPLPTPLNAIYPQNRQLSRRLRVFLDWVANLFAKADL